MPFMITERAEFLMQYNARSQVGIRSFGTQPRLDSGQRIRRYIPSSRTTQKIKVEEHQPECDP